jgi:dTDP-4-dehydrorhamnose reductase
MLGQDLVAAARAEGLDVTALTHSELDIADRDAVDALVPAAAPDLLVNCAAWTDVDGAEEAVADALAVNGTGAGNVARAADACGAWTIHISSDYVFDGTKQQPYLESDPTNPLSEYGRSKLAGEVEVAKAAPTRHTILRSSWLFGTHGRCFPKTILGLAQERDELSVVDDQRGCPTFTEHLAQAIIELTDHTPPPGVLHLAGAGECSWFEFASYLVELAGLSCAIRPVSTAEMPRPAVRPAYSVLRSERTDRPELPSWRQGADDFMAVRV